MQAPVLARLLGMQTDHTIELPRIIVMTDDDRLVDPAPIIPSLPEGSAVIIRSKSIADRDYRAHAVSDLCRHHDVMLLVSYDTPPTRLIGDGVHIPEARRSHWRRKDFWRLSPSLVTTSAHDLASAQRATKFGADAVLLSPLRATKSHPGGRTLGFWRGATICRHIELPTIALGGIDQKSMARAIDLGFYGGAGISIFKAPNTLG